jgi:AraC-like DNA-binding protein
MKIESTERELSSFPIHYQKFKLHPSLNPFIAYCWHITIDKRYEDSVSDIHIPDGLMELIFAFEGSYDKFPVNSSNPFHRMQRSSILGIQTRSNHIKVLDKIRMLGVKITPLGSALLFGNKASYACDQCIGITDLGFNWLNELQNRLEPLAMIQDMAALLSQTFLERLNLYRETVSLRIIASCINLIEQYSGNITVKQLSAYHHKEIRQIQRYFAEHLDINPKQYIDIVRFKRLYREILLHGIQITKHSDFGYYDQSHFINDFRRRTGVAPSKAFEVNFIEKNRILKINLE